MKTNMKTNINSILRMSPVNSTRGAPMGSSGVYQEDQLLVGLLCQRVNLSGDYAPDGTYWGHSPKVGSIYAVFNPNGLYKPAHGLLMYYRAHGRQEAINLFLEDHPGAEFKIDKQNKKPRKSNNFHSMNEIENGTKRRINSYFRANDESNKWPICNKFNATERAIRRLKGEYSAGGLEYFYALDSEICRIVNSAV